MNFVLVLIGGGAGSLLRYMVQLAAGKGDGHSFPWSTFLVNIIGCALIGAFSAFALKNKWGDAPGLFIMTGLLGGFTTFSSFSADFVELAKNNHIGLALLYVGLTNFVGLSLTAISYYLLR